ncbi:hypothetical protein V8C42DRAFT_349498 [Trichoderma barbatum]
MKLQLSAALAALIVVDGASSPYSVTPSFTTKQLFDATVHFWDSWVAPENQAQCNSVNSTLFAANVVGQVDITQVFTGQELNTEYIFCLFSNSTPTPDFVSIIGIPTNYTITHFAANDYIVSVALIANFDLPIIGTSLPVEVDAFMTFDSDLKVTQYDITARRFDHFFDTLITAAQPLLGTHDAASTVALVGHLLDTGICSTAATFCKGNNQQYSSNEECLKFLQGVRVGTSYELGMNTKLCRMVHSKMVPLRPDVHCPHIGPTGGHFCVDGLTYAEQVLQPIYNIPMVPAGLSQG